MKETRIQGLKVLEEYRQILLYCLVGVLIGLAVSVAEVVFGLGLNAITAYHERIGNILLLGLPAGGLLIVFLFQKWGQPVREGVKILFDVDQKKKDRVPRRLVWLMIVTTWITHFFGGSAGKEGVAIQVGAGVSDMFSGWFPKKKEKSIFLVTGIAAGFAGLFRTPFTAVFFAMEVLAAGKVRYKAMGPALCAAFTASWFSSLFGLQALSKDVEFTFTLDLTLTVKLFVLSLAFALAGQMFILGMRYAKKGVSRCFHSPYVRMLVFSCLLSALLLFWGWGRYSGLSEEIVEGCFHNGEIYWYDWLGKMVCTICTLAIGFQGGEVAPLYTIGAALGYVIGPMVGMSSAVGAMLGFAGVFGAGTNTYLASIMIGMEVFGYRYFPLFFIVCSIVHVLCRNLSIYSAQQVLSE